MKLGRFRGTKITGDILDNRQERYHAFGMVREAMAWLRRTLPISARFPEGEIFREDRFPVPLSALREIILNSIMHRDYSNPGSYVAIAIFDDRIEVRSIGELPPGVTVKSLSRTHSSVSRNPHIAEAFHITGAVEVWGRGTNRVIEECKRHEIRPPTFEERDGLVYVTFHAEIVPGAKGPSKDQVGTKSGLSEEQVKVIEKCLNDSSIQELQKLCKKANRTKFRETVIKLLLEKGMLEMTIPDKPRSSKQQYRTTALGKKMLEGKS